MGRDGTGVEARGKSIRVNFTLDGQWQRVRLAMPPTPKNLVYAEKLVEKVRRAIDRGTFDWEEYFPGSPQAKATKPAHTFGEWCVLWLKTKGRLATNTLTQYDNALKVWTDLLGADTSMERLTHAVVSSKVGGTPWKSAKLLNNYLIPLRGVFALAGRDLKTENPMEGIENSKHQAPPPDPLSPDEMEKILANMRRNCDLRAWAYFEFAFMTGMRPEEIIELRWGDVDWANQTIRVSRARTAAEVKPLKTYSARDVDLVSRAVAALEFMKAQPAGWQEDDADREMGRRIFQNPTTGRPWHDERSQRDTFWRPTLRREGIRWRRAYQTRHTFATNALSVGVNPAYIARQMGHANAKMLFTVYAKWIDGADRGREKAKMEQALERHESSRTEESPTNLPRCLDAGSVKEEISGRRDWTRTNDPHHVKVVL